MLGIISYNELGVSEVRAKRGFGGALATQIHSCYVKSKEQSTFLGGNIKSWTLRLLADNNSRIIIKIRSVRNEDHFNN